MFWKHRRVRSSIHYGTLIAFALLIAIGLFTFGQASQALAMEATLEAADSESAQLVFASVTHSAESAPRVTPSSRGASRSPNPDISTPERFIEVVGEAAQDSHQGTRVPASVTVAQAILESNWGKSGLSKKAFNLFGIKAQRGPGPAGIIKMNTWEVFGGSNVVVNDGFRAYYSIFESVEDHGLFLRDNARYAAAFKVAEDAREFARRIHAAGYATDPAYSDKLIRIMDKYNLYRFDVLSAR